MEVTQIKIDVAVVEYCPEEQPIWDEIMRYYRFLKKTQQAAVNSQQANYRRANSFRPRMLNKKGPHAPSGARRESAAKFAAGELPQGEFISPEDVK